MTKTRQSPLLNLPTELLCPTNGNRNASSYESALTLLKLVLQGNEADVLKIAQTNPQLFFAKTTTTDIAMDLEGNRRIIQDWSPYQAMFGTGDKDMLAAVKPFLDAYLKTLPNGEKMASQQVLEKFPNGFDFRPCSDEFITLINELAVAITYDQQLQKDSKNPNPATLKLLMEVRKHYKPGNVETGHHFNMNDFIKTHEINKRFWNTWDRNQLDFFSVNVIGFQERLLTAPYLQAVCMGLDNLVNRHQPLKRSFEVPHHVTDKKITVAPFKSEDTSRLGEAFSVNSFFGAPLGLWVGRSMSMLHVVEKLCQVNTAEFSRLMHMPKKQVTSSYTNG